MNDDHTYDGSNYADAECYMEDAHSLDFDGDRPRALIAMAFAQVKATLAIADALADLKPEPVTVTHPWSNPLTMTHPWPPWPSTLPDVDAADRYAANEERQRKEAEPDPLDEDDHRDRLDADGWRWTRRAHLWCPESCACYEGSWKLDQIDDGFGPLTFAPEPPPDAARDDLTASEGESGDTEGSDTDDAPEALLCPECGHGVDEHGWDGYYAITRCLTCYGPNDCRQAPSDIARHLIASAVKAERTRMTAQLRLTTSSAQDSGDLAELDALADEWEAGTDG